MRTMKKCCRNECVGARSFEDESDFDTLRWKRRGEPSRWQVFTNCSGNRPVNSLFRKW